MCSGVLHGCMRNLLEGERDGSVLGALICDSMWLGFFGCVEVTVNICETPREPEGHSEMKFLLAINLKPPGTLQG